MIKNHHVFPARTTPLPPCAYIGAQGGQGGMAELPVGRFREVQGGSGRSAGSEINWPPRERPDSFGSRIKRSSSTNTSSAWSTCDLLNLSLTLLRSFSSSAWDPYPRSG